MPCITCWTKLTNSVHHLLNYSDDSTDELSSTKAESRTATLHNLQDFKPAISMEKSLTWMFAAHEEHNLKASLTLWGLGFVHETQQHNSQKCCNAHGKERTAFPKWKYHSIWNLKTDMRILCTKRLLRARVNYKRINNVTIKNPYFSVRVQNVMYP